MISNNELSNKLLEHLTALPTDLVRIEEDLKSGKYSKEEITKAVYGYLDACCREAIDFYENTFEDGRYSEAVLVPGLISTNMPEVFSLLLKYEFDPNVTVNEKTIIQAVSEVYNGYVAADTLRILFDNGANPEYSTDNKTLFSNILFDIWLAGIEQRDRRIYDSIVHSLLVTAAYSAFGKNVFHLFPKQRSETEIKEFEIEDFKEHQNYTYGLSNVETDGEEWSLHIFDKRTRWEVARY